MPLFQLRTYRLSTPEAAAAYLPRWERHVHSLKQFGVETHGFFSVPSAPDTVVALVSMDDHLDPEVVTHEYLQSDALKQDMAGFDRSQIEAVHTLTLTPGASSPVA